MVWLLASAALGAGTTPEDRVEVFADTGVFTGQLGLAFGIGAGTRRGPLVVTGTGAFGGRADPIGTGASERPGFGLGTLAFSLDDGGASTRVGVTVLADVALLDRIEQDCTGPSNCRHGWFVPVDLKPGWGFGFQPAAGLRIAGAGASGSRFAIMLGAQPHWRYGAFLPLPRGDLLVSLGPDWSVHGWAGRYGMAIGVGRTLSRPK